MSKVTPQASGATPDSRRFWHPKIEMRSIKKLRSPKQNARTHPKKQRDKLLAVVRQCGFINPILVDEHGNILSGNLRKQIAEMMDLRQVPVIQISHLTELEKRALALAENRIALDAGWDRETLAIELGELAVLLPEAQIEFAITGFEIAETDQIITDHAESAEQTEEDRSPEPGPPVARPRNLWVMGRHRLYCGDARDSTAFTALMHGDMATMVFTDAPYNVSIGKHARARSFAFRACSRALLRKFSTSNIATPRAAARLSCSVWVSRDEMRWVLSTAIFAARVARSRQQMSRSCD